MTTFNHCVFVRKFSKDDFIILLLYVDDILIVGKIYFQNLQVKKDIWWIFCHERVV